MTVPTFFSIFGGLDHLFSWLAVVLIGPFVVAYVVGKLIIHFFGLR